MRWGVLLLLAAAWLSWSGPYTLHEWPIAVFGVASCLFVWRLYLALDRAAGGDWEFFHLSAWLRLPRFLVRFAVAVSLANLHVTRLILLPNLEFRAHTKAFIMRSVLAYPRLARMLLLLNARIQPQLLNVPATQTTPFGQVLHANFITLTPGTITLDVRDGTLLVYALDTASATEVMDGSIDRIVGRLEGSAR